MTPAINIAKKLKLDYQVHPYEHDPNVNEFGMEVVEKLSVPAEQVFKTLVVSDDDGKLAVALVPVSGRLDLKKMAKAVGCKRMNMAEPKLVERTTGYVLGGVSPLGQRKKLPTFIHQSANDFTTIFVSAGKRGLQIELPPQQLAEASQAKFFDILSLQ